MSKDVNGVENQFRYDGQDLIIEMNETDSITANYTFGPGIDNPLLMHRNSNYYYYVKDGLGSVMGLTDSTGSVVKEYQYSVFGKIVKETGIGILNPFAYTGREYGTETGHYYYRARYYDAAVGRFLSEDPIGFAGGLNVFQYCTNNPWNLRDPLGTDPVTDLTIAGTTAYLGVLLATHSNGKATVAAASAVAATALVLSLVPESWVLPGGMIGGFVGEFMEQAFIALKINCEGRWYIDMNEFNVSKMAEASALGLVAAIPGVGLPVTPIGKGILDVLFGTLSEFVSNLNE